MQYSLLDISISYFHLSFYRVYVPSLGDGREGTARNSLPVRAPRSTSRNNSHSNSRDRLREQAVLRSGVRIVLSARPPYPCATLVLNHMTPQPAHTNSTILRYALVLLLIERSSELNRTNLN